MRNGSKTPTTRQEQKEVNLEKSGKKLVQARLPFKIIAPDASLVDDEVDVNESAIESSGVAILPATDSGCDVSTNEVRKRKLSYNEVSGDNKSQEDDGSPAKENLSSKKTKKKKAIATIVNEEDVILLTESDGDTEKEINSNEGTKATNNTTKVSASSKTSIHKSQKRKSAGTPKSANTLCKDSGTSGGSSNKLKIKLPLSGKKKRRKSKSNKTDGDSSQIEQSFTESGDDIEIVAAELNPQKRAKIEESECNDNNSNIKQTKKQEKQIDVNDMITEQNEGNRISNDVQSITHNTPSQNKIEASAKLKDDQKSIDNKKLELKEVSEEKLLNTIKIDSDSEREKSPQKKLNLRTSTKRKSLKTLDAFVAKKEVAAEQTKTLNCNEKMVDSRKSNTSLKLKANDLKSAPSNIDDIDANDDDEVANSSASSIMDDVETDNKSIVKSDSDVIVLPANESPSQVSKVPSKQLSNLTPKQQRLMEQRKKAREDKERRLQEQKEERERKQQEERQQRQREKEEKELAKKREREEKEEQKRKDREEKEEIKRKDREEKERKRLAETEAKNEERRKRNEIKEEETRKKEEERKRKEQEKEDAENKKKKAAEAFTKFFVPKTSQRTRNTCINVEEEKIESEDGIKKARSNESLAFRPFQIKDDMRLAPIVRKSFPDNERVILETFVGNTDQKALPGSAELYLSQLKTGQIKPGKWRRPTVDVKEDNDDVIIVEDELERAAQEIVEEHVNAVERYRAKFFKFHENRRPPYFGTWRKKTYVITPRRPLAQDTKYIDYEVDSDLEWEEEEPGESLDGSDDEKEKESEDEDYEVDNEWFVPHGHLSDEELQNEDECGLGDDNTREAQKAKLKILQQEFAQEMKKKTEKIKPRLIGCIWQDYNGNQPELCPNIIWNSLNLRAMLCTSPPIIEEPTVTELPNDSIEPNSPTASNSGGLADKQKRIVLTEKMLKDLIRLVHGNRHKKDFIIKEFIAFVEQTEESIKNGDVRGPLKTVVREKIDEFALWQIIELNSKSKSKKNKKKLCWLVSDDILKKYDMQDIDLHNTWTYTLQPKFVETKIVQSDKDSPHTEEVSAETTNASSDKASPSSLKKKTKKKKADVITKFTKILTAQEKEQQLKTISESPKASVAPKSPMLSKKKESHKIDNSTAAQAKAATSVPTVKKRVPLLMSVARGQQISTPAKNALISQFLKKSKEEASEKTDLSKSKAPTATPMEIDEVVVLD